MRGGEAVLIAKATEKPWRFIYIAMSQLILSKPAEHLNGDKLDNRMSNLVPAEQLLPEHRPSRVRHL